MAVLIAVALLLVGPLGCSDQTAEANKAIDEANVHMKAYSTAGDELGRVLAQVQALPLDGRSASRGVLRVERAAQLVESQRVAAQEAKKDLARIKSLKVREEFKTYANKEIAVIDALLKQDEPTKSLAEELRTIYELVAAGKAKQQDLRVAAKRIDLQTRALLLLEAEATSLEAAANTYFDANNLAGGK